MPKEAGSYREQRKKSAFFSWESESTSSEVGNGMDDVCKKCFPVLSHYNQTVSSTRVRTEKTQAPESLSQER